MTIYVRGLSAGLIVAFAPGLLPAATINAPETVLTAFAEFDTAALATPRTDSDSAVGSSTTLFAVEALVSGFADPFPGQPNSVGAGFASAAGDSSGNFGVGVNAHFFPSANPPHSMVASGTLTKELLNTRNEVVSFGANFFIPEPVIILAGQVGDFFPVGADPALDVTANVLARIVTKNTAPDGSTDEAVVFEYGMRTFRNLLTGELGVLTTPFAGAPTVVESTGFFSFVLPELSLDLDTIAVVAPGDTLTLDFQYFATGGTGFGETAVFAAIGDPFDLTSEGGRITFVERDGAGPPPPAAIPLPSAFISLAIGLVALAFAGRRRS